MRYLPILFLALLSSCATWSNYAMQPDHSYLIVGHRQSIWASSEKDQAYNSASGLCPKGFNVQSEFPSAFKEYTLIVVCKDRPSIPVNQAGPTPASYPASQTGSQPNERP